MAYTGGHVVIDGWDELIVVESELPMADGGKVKAKSLVVRQGPLAIEIRTTLEEWPVLVSAVAERRTLVPATSIREASVVA